MTQEAPPIPVHPVLRPIPHHSRYSGFEQLGKYIGDPIAVPAWLYRIRGLGPIHRYFRRQSGMEWYDGLYPELTTAWHMRTHSRRIYHFIFGDNDYRFLPALMPRGKHLVMASYHSTPSEFSRIVKYTDHIRKLSAVTVVSHIQIPLLESLVGKGKVHFVPIGVNTSHYVPSPQNETGSKICLCVGHHLRDISTLCEVAALVKEKDPEVRFVLIDAVFSVFYSEERQRDLKERFASLGNIQLKTEVSDQELLNHYQTSDLLVLPLVDSTANVALLEALSCGLPPVITEVGGVRDYLDDDCALFASPQNAAAMAGHVLELLRDSGARQERSRACRRKAMAYDWSAIGRQLNQVYQAICDSL